MNQVKLRRVILISVLTVGIFTLIYRMLFSDILFKVDNGMNNILGLHYSNYTILNPIRAKHYRTVLKSYLKSKNYEYHNSLDPMSVQNLDSNKFSIIDITSTTFSRDTIAIFASFNINELDKSRMFCFFLDKKRFAVIDVAVE